jgi:hypothetical protein
VELSADDPWSEYARTIVKITDPSGVMLVVRAAPLGEVGQWPWPSADAVHILTAWDPGAERPGVEVNRKRQASLERDLQTRAVVLWPAVGVDPMTGHREEGVAAVGLARADAAVLAARYRQDALFRWTREEWAIEASDGGRCLSRGWTLLRLT